VVDPVAAAVDAVVERPAGSLAVVSVGVGVAGEGDQLLPEDPLLGAALDVLVERIAAALSIVVVKVGV
jgi:hypothetical protein